MACLCDFLVGKHAYMCYNIIKGKEVLKVGSKIKELSKLVAQLEKLVIRIISLVGWIQILIKITQ